MLKQVFGDFLLLYKNFLHWNVSKILIYIAAFIFAFVLSLPFFLGMFAVMYVSPVNWGEIVWYYAQTNMLPVTFYESINVHMWYFIWSGFLAILGILMLIAGFMQYLLTTTKLYLWYIDGEKVPFLGNIYFNFKIFWKYVVYLGWVGLILLLPLLVFLVGFITLVVSFGGVELLNESANINGFILSVSIFGLLCLIWFIYTSFRFGYGYLALVDEKNYPEKQSWIFYLKESFKLTKGKFWKFFGIILLFSICIYFPIWIIEGILYEIVKNDILNLIWSVGMFLFFTLSYEMLFVSLYRRLFLENKEEKNTSKEEEKTENIEEVI